MSYDLRLCLPQPGRSPDEIATSDVTLNDHGEVSAKAQERVDSLASLLVDENTAFDRCPRVDEPARGSVELTTRDGIQISVSPSEASIGVPYWYDDAEAELVFMEIRDYLEILVREGGFFVYDPQLGRLLGEDEIRASLGCYQRCRQQFGNPVRNSKAGTWRRLFPATLDRMAYLGRWSALSGCAAILFYLTTLATVRTRFETLVLVIPAVWFVAKIVFLDPSRLENIGWSNRLTFVSIFPPAAIVLQLLLFFVRPRPFRKKRH